jgi:hypothetical protein
LLARRPLFTGRPRFTSRASAARRRKQPDQTNNGHNKPQTTHNKPLFSRHETKTAGSELTAHHTPQHTAITDRPEASSDAAGASAHHQMRPRAPLRLHMGHP